MSNDFLSQEEIDALLNGKTEDKGEDKKNLKFELDENQKDLLGEVGNISMGSASTALSQIIDQEVLITTPEVEVTTLAELKNTFEVPNVSVEVNYVSGILGENILVMKLSDAAIIADLMMGGDGKNVSQKSELSELEESAVLEAMNQMIGSSATSMATMLSREINISPPKSKIWEEDTSPLADGIKDEDVIVKVAFKLTVGKLINSHIMQILPIDTALKIINIMMGNEDNNEENMANKEVKQEAKEEINSEYIEKDQQEFVNDKGDYMDNIDRDKVEVKKANFMPLKNVEVNDPPKNIDLILDVPLEISVVLGRTKMKIKDILNLSSGSLIELDKLAEEPVEILVNGKTIAYGEVVVVDENFGVRITSIVSSEERIKSLK